MNRQSELFPETLLVDVIDGQSYASTLKVADHFQKQHKDVLKALNKLLADCPDLNFRERNFAPTFYDVPGPNNSVRQEKMYTMTEEGFALLAMGFTGAKAMQWKIDFLNAFFLMRQCLAEKEKRWANAMRLYRQHWQTILDGTEAGESRATIASKTGHRSVASITANRRRMRLAGLMGGRHV